MSILHQIAQKIKGDGCERLVKSTENTISLSGASIVEGSLKFDVGDFSKKIRELVHIPDVAVGLDDSQYHLCRAILEMKHDQRLREEYTAIRLQLILALNQLRAILHSIKQEPTPELKRALGEWLKYVNQLQKESIILLNPESPKAKSGMTLKQIRQYQGIDEKELQEAIFELLRRH